MRKLLLVFLYVFPIVSFSQTDQLSLDIEQIEVRVRNLEDSTRELYRRLNTGGYFLLQASRQKNVSLALAGIGSALLISHYAFDVNHSGLIIIGGVIYLQSGILNVASYVNTIKGKRLLFPDSKIKPTRADMRRNFSGL